MSSKILNKFFVDAIISANSSDFSHGSLLGVFISATGNRVEKYITTSQDLLDLLPDQKNAEGAKLIIDIKLLKYQVCVSFQKPTDISGILTPTRIELMRGGKQFAVSEYGPSLIFLRAVCEVAEVHHNDQPVPIVEVFEKLKRSIRL